MTPEIRQNIEKHMRELGDRALCFLIAVEQSQYEPEAVDVAREELRRRGLPILSAKGYWEQFPAEWMANMRFCYRCWAATTDDSPGPVYTINFIGCRLFDHEDECPTCGSYVQRKWFCVIAPVIPLSRYRVIRFSNGGYIGRLLPMNRSE